MLNHVMLPFDIERLPDSRYKVEDDFVHMRKLTNLCHVRIVEKFSLCYNRNILRPSPPMRFV